MPPSYPPSSPEANGSDQALEQRIQQRIKETEDGTLSFETFMEMALYDPRAGYYAQARQRTGRQGDFFTSVSVGPLLGKALALQFQEMWQALGRPETFHITEFGAEDGQLALDILGGIKLIGNPDFVDRVCYRIWEPLMSKQAIQRDRLHQLVSIEWIGDEPPPPSPGVVFGNEVIDALPCHLIEMKNGAWHERRIALDSAGQLIWTTLPLEKDSRLQQEIETSPSLAPNTHPEDYRTELRLGDETLLSQALGLLDLGFVLFIDYGFPAPELYSPARPEGTLQCYHRHRKNSNPLQHPGDQDISAHVDFSRLARLALAQRAHLLGWVDQHRALTGLLSIGGETPALLREEADPAKTLRQLQTLLHPEALGGRFHWLLLGQGNTSTTDPLSAWKYGRPSDLQILAPPLR